MRRLQHDFGKGAGGVEPVAVQADVIFAPLHPVDRQPVDEIGIGGATDAREQRQPCRHRLGAPGKRGDRPLDPRTRRSVEPVGRLGQHRLQPAAERNQRAEQRVERMGGGGRSLDQLGAGLGKLGFQAVAGIARLLGARKGQPAHRGEQRFDGSEGLPLRHAAEPALRGESLRGGDGVGDGAVAALVIAGDIGQAGGQAAATTAAARLRPQHPAAQLDRLGTGERGGEHRIGGIEQVVSFVEDVAGGAGGEFATARGVDHDQRMVGDDDIGLGGGTRGMLDEAFAIMRAAGIDTLAAPIGQRGGAVAAEQRRQPAGQVAADHVAVRAICRPARHQLRQNGGTAGKAALQRILQVEQAQIVLATFTRHHAFAADRGVGEQALRLHAQLALQRLGKGGDPDRTAGTFRPQAGGCEIPERLADPGARLRQHHVRCLTHDARGEGGAGGGGIGALAGAFLRTVAGQRRQSRLRLWRFHGHGAGGGAGGLFLPFRQLAEQPAFVDPWLGQARRDQRCPGPAQAGQALRGGPGALPLGPVAIRHGEQRRGRIAQERGDRILLYRHGEIDGACQPLGRRHREPRREEKGIEFEQVEPGQVGIAQPLTRQRGVEQNHRRFRRDADRLAARHRTRPLRRGDPDAAMAGVESGMGKGHRVRYRRDGTDWQHGKNRSADPCTVDGEGERRAVEGAGKRAGTGLREYAILRRPELVHDGGSHVDHPQFRDACSGVKVAFGRQVVAQCRVRHLRQQRDIGMGEIPVADWQMGNHDIGLGGIVRRQGHRWSDHRCQIEMTVADGLIEREGQPGIDQCMAALLRAHLDDRPPNQFSMTTPGQRAGKVQRTKLLHGQFDRSGGIQWNDRVHQMHHSICAPRAKAPDAGAS